MEVCPGHVPPATRTCQDPVTTASRPARSASPGGLRHHGEGTNLTYTRVDGGFRLEGFWRYDRFNLLLTREKAVAAGREFLPDALGAYTAGGAAGTRILLEGRATGLGDPAWPQMALTAAVVEWGKEGGTYPENPGQVTPATWR